MRFRTLIASALSVAVLSGVVACSLKSREEIDSSGAQHTEGQTTWAREGFVWHDETEEEFRQTVGGTYLPSDHPLTARLQYWIDTMDGALRRDHPDLLQATPRPRILILNTTMKNAWVQGAFVQWNVKSRFDTPFDGPADAAPPAPPVMPDGGAAPPFGVFLSPSGKVFAGYVSGIPDRPHDEAQLKAFAELYNGGLSKCRLSVENGEVVFGAGCERPFPIENASVLHRLAIRKFITITSSYLAEMMDEDRVVSTLAHELGHYYRAHSAMPWDLIFYFYSIDESLAHKPPPDPRFLAQTLRVREKLKTGATDWAEENELMAKHRLGFYTTEQEADEMALEMMAKVGIAPGVAMDKFLKMMQGRPAPPGALGYAECAALADKNFRDPQGKLVTVPVGDPNNIHHSSCFRVFNVMREIEAHTYALAPRPSPPGGSWFQLLAQLADLPDGGALQH